MSRYHQVKVELAKRNESQKSCAKAVGIAPSVLTKILNDHMRPWPAIQHRLALHLNMTISELFPGGETGE